MVFVSAPETKPFAAWAVNHRIKSVFRLLYQQIAVGLRAPLDVWVVVSELLAVPLLVFFQILVIFLLVNLPFEELHEL